MELSDIARTDQIAHTLASAYARATIESLGEWATEDGWYDLSSPECQDAADVRLSLEYLERLGSLERMAGHPGIVRLKPTPCNTVATPSRTP